MRYDGGDASDESFPQSTSTFPRSAMQDSPPTDGQAMKLFADIYAGKAKAIAQALGARAPYGDGAKDDFSTERKLLLSDLRALQWGFTSGLLWLVAFRRAPNNIRKYYVHRSTSVPASQFLADRPFLYLGLLATHWGLSYWVGASVTVALSDRTPMAEKLRNIPLTEGRSVVSDKMCPDFISTYDTIKEQGFDWNNVERKLPASEARNQMSNLSNLYNVAAFVTNCKKRNAYEDQLRNERGVLHNAPVAIPSPGVPVETEVEGSDVDEFDRVQNEIDFDDGMN